MGSSGWTAGRIQCNRCRVSNLVSSGPYVHRGGFLAEFRVSNRGHGFRVTWVHQSSAYCSKVLLIVLKAQMGVAPKYLRDAIRLPTSATSLRPLRSMDRRELFFPPASTTLAMSRSFFLISPSPFNQIRKT